MAPIKINNVKATATTVAVSGKITITFVPFQDINLVVTPLGDGTYQLSGSAVTPTGVAGFYNIDPRVTIDRGDGTYDFLEYGAYNVSDLREVYALINGQKVVATYNSTTGTYSVVTNAPAASSWSQPDHVYPVTLHAEDVAGNVVEMTTTDPTYGNQLKIRVLEKTKPTVTIASPTQNAVLGSSTQAVKLELLDSGGSGLNMDTVVLKINGVTVTSGLTWTDGTGGKKLATYNATGLSDGSNTITLQVTDNDGNVSTLLTRTFIISTAAPTLTVNTPVDNLQTNVNKVTVAGSAAAGSQYVTLSGVTINGVAATVTAGSFSYEYTLTEGVNTITVVARDSVGKTTTVTRQVTLDSKVPIITDVVAEAVTVDAGGTIRITFKVTDPS